MKWGSLIIPISPALFWGGIAIALLLIFGASYLELRRATRKRLVWRLMANGAAIISLLAMALQPQWLSSSRPASALLITPGADAQTLQSLADSLPQIFVPGENAAWKSIYPNLQTIPDAAYLQRHYPEINSLHVVGHGLNDYDLDELDAIQIKFYLSPLPIGIKYAHWPREIAVGQTLRIQGTLAGLNNETYWLYLTDPGSVVDSAKIVGPNETRFALSATPHASGKFLYVVSLKSTDGKIPLEEQIDVVVVKPQPLKILILTSTVSFETKYLKNWASQNQNALAMRSAISRERYRFEFLNRPPIDLSRVNAGLLRQFDLVLIDGKTLRALKAAEQQALRAAVAQEGLGVLMLPDESVFENNSPDDFFLNFEFEKFPDLDERSVKPRWPERQHLEITAIPAEPFAIKPVWGMKPLIADEMARILAGAYHRGNGLIGLSLVRDSYQWILEGHAQFHAAYWSHLLSALARKDYDKDHWNIPTTKPLIIDQPHELVVETNMPSPVGIVTSESGGSDSLYLQQEVMEAQHWHATFWPRQAGWHQVALVGGEPRWFYVCEKTNWETWQTAQKIGATQRHALRYQNQTTTWRSARAKAESISLSWFFILFSLSSVYLWIERKIW